MSSRARLRTHLSRHLQFLREQRGLRPGPAAPEHRQHVEGGHNHLAGNGLIAAGRGWYSSDDVEPPLRRPASDIGKALLYNRERFGMRWSVRFSDAADIQLAAMSRERAEPVKGQSFVCPEQTGAASNCANCALCWHQPEQQVIFLTH